MNILSPQELVQKTGKRPTWRDVLWLLEYTRRSEPEIAARNNNRSAREELKIFYTGTREHLTPVEFVEVSKWFLRFLREEQMISEQEHSNDR